MLSSSSLVASWNRPFTAHKPVVKYKHKYWQILLLIMTIFHHAFFYRFGAGNVIYFASGTFQLF